MIAPMEARKAGLFASRSWASNIVSGLIVSIVASPLGLAFAIASGVRPEQGIATSIISGLVVSTLGGSRIQIAGPTGAFIVILAGIAARFGVVILGPRLPYCRRVPGPLLGLLAATCKQAIHPLPGIATIGSTFGGIPQGLPQFAFAVPGFDRVVQLLPSAFTIAMLGAIARTATNFRNGGNSPLAGIVHSLTLLLVLLFASPLAGRIPLCALAAILFVVAWNMSDARHFWRMLRTAPRADACCNSSAACPPRWSSARWIPGTRTGPKAHRSSVPRSRT